MRTLSTIAKGSSSHIVDRRRVVIGTPDEWAALWAAHAGPASVAPSVNFGSAVVAAAFAGSQGAPHASVEIVGAVEEDGGTRLVVEEGPLRSESESTVAMSPFHIVLLPRLEGDIRWTDAPAGRVWDPGDRGSRTEAESTASATGLRPRTAGVLSYLAGPVSGVIMLVAEPDQAFVRFHAWQSVIALGVVSAAVILCYLLALASLFFTANGLAVMVRVATGVWIALLALWAVLMWQAWKGRAWKLPIAGAWAERLAARNSPRRPASSS